MSDVWDPESEIEENRHNWSGEPKHFEPVDAAQRDENKPKAIDLFCGPGGISAGLEWAGFEPVLGVDIHEPSVETYRRNHPGAHAILGDIRRINKRNDDDRDIFEVIESNSSVESTLLAEVAEEALAGDELSLLTAGIPCQGFSIANRKQHDEDERNYLFEEFIRGVRLLNPKHILIENVSTMKSADDGGFVDAIEECLDILGYSVDHRILNAADFGVPQKRRRLFFLGTRTDAPLIWPEPTHEGTPRSTEDALADLPPLDADEESATYDREGNPTEFQRLMREGVKSEEDLWNHKAPNHRQTTIDRVKETDPGEPMYDRFRQRIRLHPDEPGPTIIAGGIRPQFQYGHFSQSRGLSVRERARLQSFPDQFKFEGGTVQGRVQTGMAVPPLLAKHIGEAIRTSQDAELFVRTVLDEYGDKTASRPWRSTDSTPYEVLVGEILERDTPSETVEAVFSKFIEKYPDERSLTEADVSQVTDLLAEFGVDGTVARNLRDIMSQVMFSGVPESEGELTKLPHIDRAIAYTILCFGHGKRCPAVDENVTRIYERFFDISVSDPFQEDDHLWDFARAILPEDDYLRYNRAVIEFASDYCVDDSLDSTGGRVSSLSHLLG